MKIPNFKKPLIISSCFLSTVIIFEYLIDRHYRKKLKKNINKNIKEIRSDKYKNYYYKSLSKIKTEINHNSILEKNHIIASFTKTFKDMSTNNVTSVINKLILYGSRRTISNENMIFEDNLATYLSSVDRMLWYPYTFRFFVSLINNVTLLKWKTKYNLKCIQNSKFCLYNIKQKNDNYNKTIIIFIGLCGFLFPFNKIIEILTNNGYMIIIPIYGPSQASLNYNFNYHEAEYHINTYNYLSSLNIDTIEILSWSLGGILYKGFENLIISGQKMNANNYNYKIKINKVFLIEPLIGIRACMDTYFCQIRSFKDTYNIMNSVTRKKYRNANYIFSYIIHSIIGYSTSNSFGYFQTTEFKNDKINYPRYLFLSSDDIIMNIKLDKDLIEKNFDKNKVFNRIGYHGGWLRNKNVFYIMDNLTK